MNFKNIMLKLEDEFIKFVLRVDNRIIHFLNDEQYLELMYKHLLNKKLDLDNPKTYNEKLQWLKLNNRKPIYTTMVDKYEAKKYVSDLIGEKYVIPTLGIYDDFNNINFDELPNQFVIKTTHDCGGISICHDKQNFDINASKKFINKHLKKNYYYSGREWPYKNVKPRILIEKYMEDTTDKELRDYKFFCFDGKVKLLFIASNRQGIGDTYFDFYDEKFNHLDIKNGHDNSPNPPHKPINFDTMIKYAEKLSANLPHIRIDFYEVNGKIYFGEMTFYHWSGFVPFEPEEWDRKLGDLINLELVKKNEL